MRSLGHKIHPDSDRDSKLLARLRLKAPHPEATCKRRPEWMDLAMLGGAKVDGKKGPLHRAREGLECLFVGFGEATEVRFVVAEAS